MKRWLGYAVASGVLLAVAALAVSAALPGSGAAVGLAALLAWVVQLLAFAGLLAARRRPETFMIGWGGGMLLRFVVVVAFAFWLTRASDLPAAPALVSLVAFVFVLVLLEPLFLRMGNDA